MRQMKSPGTVTRGVMLGAPLVLHGQDQDGNFPFIGSVFSVGIFHHRRDAESVRQTFRLIYRSHFLSFGFLSSRIVSGPILTHRAAA
jgi:hypothetical protein